MNPPSENTITQQDAQEIAQQAVDALSDEHDFVIMEDKTMKREFGWVFFYDTKKFLETGDPDFSAPGNGPLIVHQADGQTEFVSSSVPPPVAIDEYEKRWRDEQDGN